MACEEDSTMNAFDRFYPMLARRAAAEAAWLAIGAGGPSGKTPTEERARHIREAAYFKAERRGFAPGHELEDWVAAEQEVDRASRPLPRS
jgi:hypothetical protein